jgi:hypothetical protein
MMINPKLVQTLKVSKYSTTLALILFLSSCETTPPQYNSVVQEEGCSLNLSPAQVRQRWDLRGTTGQAFIDNQIKVEAKNMNEAFNVYPGVTYFVTPKGVGGNAHALVEDLFKVKMDGTVLMGLTLIQEIYDSFGDQGDSALIGILAHEWAHIYQFNDNKLKAMPVTWRELQADFLAGWFLGLRMNEGLILDMKSFSRTVWVLGDFGFTNPDHHGTPKQRTFAMLEGYAYAREVNKWGIKAAVKESLVHIKLNPYGGVDVIATRAK